MDAVEITAHNVRRIFAIAEILDSKSRAALAGRFLAEFVVSPEDWRWCYHQLSADDLLRLKRFLGE